jgi:hypothetical protein
MKFLWEILDGINDSDFPDQVLGSISEIVRYAGICGRTCSKADAVAIQAVGVRWRNEQAGGEDLARVRAEAKAALD